MAVSGCMADEHSETLSSSIGVETVRRVTISDDQDSGHGTDQAMDRDERTKRSRRRRSSFEAVGNFMRKPFTSMKDAARPDAARTKKQGLTEELKDKRARMLQDRKRKEAEAKQRLLGRIRSVNADLMNFSILSCQHLPEARKAEDGGKVWGAGNRTCVAELPSHCTTAVCTGTSQPLLTLELPFCCLTGRALQGRLTWTRPRLQAAARIPPRCSNTTQIIT